MVTQFRLAGRDDAPRSQGPQHSSIDSAELLEAAGQSPGLGGEGRAAEAGPGDSGRRLLRLLRVDKEGGAVQVRPPPWHRAARLGFTGG